MAPRHVRKGSTPINSNNSNKVGKDKSELQEISDNTPVTSQNDIEVDKRPINYQIAKNRGLTPHRKKELRNPRVKHRNKYRKATIRRKGAVSIYFVFLWGGLILLILIIN